MPAQPERKTISPAVATLLLVNVAVLALVVVYAWLGDDAYITLRTVKNFVEGRGLTWNPGERVQAYTHPLWMFLLSFFYFFTREAFYTTLVVSFACSATTIYLVQRYFTNRRWDAVAVVLLLGFSRAFIDYSTSGLENPLSHLLIAIFAHQLFRRAPLQVLALTAALGMLNRMDLGALFAPALAWRTIIGFRSEGRAFTREFLRAAFIGGSPFILWELFSLFYYGSFVPNTALAKLNHGHPKIEVVVQGVLFLADSLRNDPLTMVTIAASLAVPWVTRQREHAMLAVGVLGYVLYIVWVGGDFMSGRFLTSPFVAAVILLACIVLDHAKAALPVAAVAVVLGFAGHIPTPMFAGERNNERAKIGKWGIADERRYYASKTSLFAVGIKKSGPNHAWRRQGESLSDEPRKGELRAVHTKGNIGLTGYYASPEVTLIDVYGLADPLLARLPARRGVTWRIGHFSRAVPSGYLQSVRTGESHFGDEDLGELWETIDLVTRGPLFSKERLRAIWKLNTKGKKLVEFDAYYYWGASIWELDEVRKVPNKPRHDFTEQGAFIELPEVQTAAAVALAISPGEYDVIFRNNDEIVGRVELHTEAEPQGKPKKRGKKGKKPPAPALESWSVEVPENAAEEGFDELHILPTQGYGPYYVEGIELRDEP